MGNKDKKKAQTGVGAIKDNFDFWVDATDFIKTIVDKDAEQKIANHIKERGFNDNETRFFRECITKAFDLIPMMAYLKSK